MAQSTFQQVVELHALGQFGDALKALRSSPVRHGDDDYLASQGMLVKLLEMTGDYDSAERLGNGLLARAETQPAVKAAVLTSLSRINGYRDNIEKSWQQAVLACQLTAHENDISLSCRCQLRLFALQLDRMPLDSLRPQLIELRRNVYRSGDPHLIVRMRVRAAEIDGKQGNIPSALQHIKRARALLQSYPNLWLEACCALDASALSYHSSDFGRAVEEAERAVHYALMSGYLYGRIAAIGNLGLVHLSRGNVEKASEHLRQHIRLVRGFPGLERQARGAYADLLMALGRFDESREVLGEDLPLLERITDRSWDLLGAGLTLVRLFRYFGKWNDAARLAATLIRTADFGGYRWYGIGARASAIEPLTQLKRHTEAIGHVIAAEALGYEAPLDSRIDVLLAKSTAFAAAGLTRIAADAAQTALLGACVTGDLLKQVEACNALTTIVTRVPVNTPLQCGDVALGRTITRGLDTTTNLLGHGRTAAPLMVLATGFDNAANAELYANSIFTVFMESGCATSLALVVRQPPERPHVIAYSGWNYKQAKLIADDPKELLVIACGTFQNREYELVVEPKTDIESRCTAVSIDKLARAALSLERLRRDEKERSSIWPLDELAQESEGVFVASSMTEILTTAKRIAPTMLSVLLTGETGTGKEVLARAVHSSSQRAARPFVPFNCTAVPRDMIESQLFGYRRGAFTGAQEAFTGVIRGAAGGTLFLDEIGDLALDVQPKLLRFLETGEIQPIGDAHPMHVDVRIIAATNANLDHMVSEGRFREDLFYRLNVIRFRLPPLRERREEIPPLVHHFVRRFTDEFRKGRIRLTEETMEYLMLYRWPGNVRQIENELRRVIALAENDAVLTPAHLSPEIRDSRRTVPVTEAAPAANEMLVRMDQPLAAAVESLERHMVQRALDLANGHVTEAAKLLGVSRKGLFLMRKRWGLGERGSSMRSAS